MTDLSAERDRMLVDAINCWDRSDPPACTWPACGCRPRLSCPAAINYLCGPLDPATFRADFQPKSEHDERLSRGG